jgi:hypothetical protein
MVAPLPPDLQPVITPFAYSAFVGTGMCLLLCFILTTVVTSLNLATAPGDFSLAPPHERALLSFSVLLIVVSLVRLHGPTHQLLLCGSVCVCVCRMLLFPSSPPPPPPFSHPLAHLPCTHPPLLPRLHQP